MKILSQQEADSMLLALEMKVGKWHELADLGSEIGKARLRAMAPTNASELYVTSLWLMDWLPHGSWKLVQIDNSTSPTKDESILFERLVWGTMGKWDIATQRTIKFEMENENRTDRRLDVLISSVIFFALMFQWHIHVVSEGCSRGQRLALQDGIIYFLGNEKAVSLAKLLVQKIQDSPNSTPSWLTLG